MTQLQTQELSHRQKATNIAQDANSSAFGKLDEGTISQVIGGYVAMKAEQEKIRAHNALVDWLPRPQNTNGWRTNEAGWKFSPDGVFFAAPDGVIRRNHLGVCD
jgi:hypothetical protein